MKSFITFMARPNILHYTMPAIIVYLVVGTVAQKYIGLYDATQIYFSDFIFWLGPFPLPGMPALFALITLSLWIKLIFKSPWSFERAGIITTHISVLLLLLGGFFTLASSKEGYLDLAEGAVKSTVSDYHVREFALLDDQNRVLEVFAHRDLQEGQLIEFQSIPLNIEILEHCRNCAISAREHDAEYTYEGMSQHMQLGDAPLSTEDEVNISGLSFIVKDGEDNKIFLVLEGVLKHPEFTFDDRTYRLALEKQQRQLPFTVELIDFEKQLYPGTSLAQSYQSLVKIHDNGAQWKSLISMNSPLRYKGYTLYQSSYLETPEGDISVLSVVHNTGRVFPYVSGVMMCLGLFLHLLLRNRSIKKNAFKPKTVAASALVLLCLLFVSTPAKAFDLSYFSHMPVLHEGRIKPMKSLAIAKYRELSGSEDRAMDWLVETVFNPASAEMRRVIKISNPDVLNMLGLEPHSTNRYAHQELSKALSEKQEVILSILQTPEEQWTTAQIDLINVQERFVLLEDLLSSLTLFLPINVVLDENAPAALAPYAGQTLTYNDVLKFQESLKLELQKILKNKGQDIEKFTDSEQALTFLSFAADNLRTNGQKSQLLRVIPAAQSNDWHSPWSYLTNGAGHPKTADLLEKWKNLALAYHAQDEQAWRALTNEIYDETLLLSKQNTRENALYLEHFYVSYQPYKVSILFYTLAMGFLLLCRFWQIQIWAALTIGIGGLIHMSALGLRIYILERPPVSTLYESILFVALVCVFYGLWAFIKQREAKWLYIAGGLGLSLHLVGFSQNTDGDNLLMLSAVLNTNFWLATHVICITIGYAFCLLTSVLAHYELGVGLVKKETKLITNDRFKSLHTLALISLLFTGVGTILGGIWADQSWGRFWGWDPKENGALFIVLWLIWLLHARIGALMNIQYVTIGLAYLSVIVSLSWFGVNLLSIGLHSYGFTEGMVWGLALFIGLETTFVIGAMTMIHRERRKHGVT